MKRGDKKGLSTVVATLLIILLVIVAVAIVWGVIRTIIVNNSEQISLGKFTIDLQIVSIKQTPQDVNIKVKRNAGEGELEGIVFSIFDGDRTHIYEKHNVSLNQLEMKTFVLDYQGKIVSVSIYPILLESSGKTLTGGVSDTYYVTSSGGGYISGNCTTNCTGKTCGDNGCGGSCGPCSGSTPDCIQGICGINTGLIGNCSCAANICQGATCDDGLGGSCPGELTLEQDCGSLMCGPSPSGCGSCGDCADANHYCNAGSCSPICNLSDCGSRVCGGIPDRLDCGTTFCGLCNASAGETCNETSGTCFVCQPDCLSKQCGPDGCGGSCGDCKVSPFNSSYNCNASQLCQMCTQNCNALGRECGPVPNGCGESCGSCFELYGYPESSCNNQSGICIKPEESLNNGTVLSVWPLPIGHNLFVSDGLPMYGEDEKIANLSDAHFVKIVSAYKRCYQILEIDYPVNPGQYTVVKVSMASTDIEVGDYYEIWKTIEGCNR